MAWDWGSVVVLVHRETVNSTLFELAYSSTSVQSSESEVSVVLLASLSLLGWLKEKYRRGWIEERDGERETRCFQVFYSYQVKKAISRQHIIFWKARYIGPTHILALIDVPKILDLENQNVCSALADHYRSTPSNFLITCHM